MTHPLTLASLPVPLAWHNLPERGVIDADHQLTITAGAETDWFVDPAGGAAKYNAPLALFAPPDPVCRLSAKVTVDFASTYDAGVLFVYEHEALWAKLCFEFSPQRQPTLVSVVTRGASDDCNSAALATDTVYLRVYRHAEVFAFHYSLDGRFWSLVRYFTLGKLSRLTLGFSAQSPTGLGCRARFADITYQTNALSDLRQGD